MFEHGNYRRRKRRNTTKLSIKSDTRPIQVFDHDEDTILLACGCKNLNTEDKAKVPMIGNGALGKESEKSAFVLLPSNKHQCKEGNFDIGNAFNFQYDRQNKRETLKGSNQGWTKSCYKRLENAFVFDNELHNLSNLCCSVVKDNTCTTSDNASEVGKGATLSFKNRNMSMKATMFKIENLLD